MKTLPRFHSLLSWCSLLALCGKVYPNHSVGAVQRIGVSRETSLYLWINSAAALTDVWAGHSSCLKGRALPHSPRWTAHTLVRAVCFEAEKLGIEVYVISACVKIRSSCISRTRRWWWLELKSLSYHSYLLSQEENSHFSHMLHSLSL